MSLISVPRISSVTKSPAPFFFFWKYYSHRMKRKVAGVIVGLVASLEVLTSSAISVLRESCQDGHVISRLALLRKAS